MNAQLMALLVAVIAVAAIMAGCGGDDGGDSQAGSGAGATTNGAGSAPDAQDGGGSAGGADRPVTTSSLSKEEFVAVGNAACQRERKDLAKEVNAYLMKHAGRVKAEPVLLANMVKAVLLPKFEAENRAIRGLGAPEGDEEEIEAILASHQEGIDEVRSLDKLASEEALERHFGDANKMLQAYGLGGCANRY